MSMLAGCLCFQGVCLATIHLFTSLFLLKWEMTDADAADLQFGQGVLAQILASAITGVSGSAHGCHVAFV